VAGTQQQDEVAFRAAWDVLRTGVDVRKEIAASALDALWRLSHAWIDQRFGPDVSQYYPTPKRYTGRLEKKSALWWTFHSTGGPYLDPVVRWFSGEPRGTPPRPRGGSAHFVIDLDGMLLYLVRLSDGAWHCPGRNGDSVGVELVNACALAKKGAGWRWWGGAYDLVLEPMKSDPPFRGCRWWQPYPADQLGSLVGVMRLVHCALGAGRFSPVRCAQHSVYNDRKFDCGPLFPQPSVVAGGFGIDSAWSIPARVIPYARPSGMAHTDSPKMATMQDFEHGDACDLETTTSAKEETERLQRALLSLGLYRGEIDGIHGDKTACAILEFQIRWSVRVRQPRLMPLGILTTATNRAISEALKIVEQGKRWD
jgi:N-acetyl-anhydromuramyl-L-alanine amidase AmpD